MDGDWEEVGSPRLLVRCFQISQTVQRDISTAWGNVYSLIVLHRMFAYRSLNRSTDCLCPHWEHMLSRLQSLALLSITPKSSSGPETTMDVSPASTAPNSRNIPRSRLEMIPCARFFFMIKGLLRCVQEAYIWPCAVDHQYGTFRMIPSSGHGSATDACG